MDVMQRKSMVKVLITILRMALAWSVGMMLRDISLPYRVMLSCKGVSIFPY